MSIAERIASIGQHIGNAYDKLDNLGINLYKLPIDYTQVDYIESSGTQYIDTSYKPYKTKTEIKFALTSTENDKALIGAFNQNDRYYPVLVRNNNIEILNKSATTVYFIPTDTNVHTVVYNDKNNNCFLDNINAGTVSNLTEVSSNNIYLFARKGSTSAEKLTNARIYYVKIWEENVLVRNFIPCYRNSDNEVGLFDMVNNVFYTNRGTGTFIAGTETRETIDKNINNIASLLDTVYNEYPKVSDEGVSPSITGSRVGRLKSTLKASDTTQESTTGKNLLPIKSNLVETTINGMTFTPVYENNLLQYINVNGTTTASAVYDIISTSSADIRTISAGEYQLNTNKTSGEVKLFCDLKKEDDSAIYPESKNASTSITLTGNTRIIRSYLQILSGKTCNNEKIYPQLEQGSTATDYEPYTNGASPNPDYPQDIHVVRGDNSINVQTRNLLPTNKALWESGHYNTSGVKTAFSTRMRLVDLLPVLPNTTYYFLGNNFFIREYNNNKAFINNAGTIYSTQTFTTTNQTYFLGVSVDKTYSDYVEGGGSNNNIAIFYNFEIDKNWEIGGITCYPINLPVQNLFDKDNANLLKAYINTTANTIQTYGVTGVDFKTLYISCSPNTTYTISKISSQRFAVAETQAIPAGGVTVSNKIFNNTGTSITITTSADAKYLIVFYYLSSADTLTEQQIRDSIQIEPGDKANRYTPYEVAPIELCKISTYQDKLFKAIVGDTIYDTLTAEQKEGLVSGEWYKYADFGKLVLNGSETSDDIGTWRKSTTTDMDRFILDLQPAWRLYESTNATNLCNYFTTGANALGKWRNNVGSQLVFNFSEYGTTTLEQWGTWLSTHNLQLYQRLTTPTITQITDSTLVSQLENLYKAQSKNGQTNILQTNADLPFIISASALKGE